MAKSVTFSKAAGTLNESKVGIPFEPRSFEGDDPKRKIVLDLSQEAIAKIAKWESEIEAQRLSSCISEVGVRARFNMETVRVWKGADMIEMPQTLRGTANVLLTLTGIWNTKHQSGLCLHVTDIEPLQEPMQSPFQCLTTGLAADLELQPDGTESSGS